MTRSSNRSQVAFHKKKEKQIDSPQYKQWLNLFEVVGQYRP